MTRRPIATLTLFLAVATGPQAALGHGPTIRLGADAADPAVLEIEPGQTVHFVNGSEQTLRVRGDGGSFSSPELPPGGAGWHLSLPFPGHFGYSLESAPDVRGEIDVAPEP